MDLTLSSQVVQWIDENRNNMSRQGYIRWLLESKMNNEASEGDLSERQINTDECLGLCCKDTR